jgi:hypothetical protein
MSAELPRPDGGSGSITIEQSDVDVDPKGLLRQIQDSPPRYEHTQVLSFAMTIDQPDTEPLVLETKNPAILIATLTQYPPKGDLYRLQNPVDLAAPDDPDTTVVTIETFPVKMGGL